MNDVFGPLWHCNKWCELSGIQVNWALESLFSVSPGGYIAKLFSEGLLFICYYRHTSDRGHDVYTLSYAFVCVCGENRKLIRAKAET